MANNLFKKPLSLKRYVTADIAEFERLLRLCETLPDYQVKGEGTTNNTKHCLNVCHQDVILEFKYATCDKPQVHGLNLSNLQVDIQGIAGSFDQQQVLLAELDRLMQRGGG